MDNKFSQQAKQAERDVSGLNNLISKAGPLAAAAFSIDAIVSFGKSVVDSYGKMEMFKTSLTTMLHGNVNEAEALNEQLITLAKTTPFELKDVQDGTRQLIAYGFEAGKVVDTMRVLGDVASGVGAPLGDIAYLYGTLKTQDKVMSKDLYQFANRGIPILEQLAKRFKTTTSAIFDLASEGKIHFKDIEWSFKQMTSEGGQFFDLMSKQSKTVVGQISNLSDSWDQLKVAIGESQSGIIKLTLGWATDMVNIIQGIYTEQNRVENAFHKHGAKQYNFFERGGLNPFQMGIGFQNDVLARGLLHNTIQESSSNEAKLHELYSKTALSISDLITKRSKTKDSEDREFYTRQIALFKDAQDEVKGALDLLKSKQRGDKSSLATTDKEADKTKTPHYLQITINIDEMNGIKNYEAKTGASSEPINLTAEQIAKLMVTAVENAQIIAGI